MTGASGLGGTSFLREFHPLLVRTRRRPGGPGRLSSCGSAWGGHRSVGSALLSASLPAAGCPPPQAAAGRPPRGAGGSRGHTAGTPEGARPECPVPPGAAGGRRGEGSERPARGPSHARRGLRGAPQPPARAQGRPAAHASRSRARREERFPLVLVKKRKKENPPGRGSGGLGRRWPGAGGRPQPVRPWS